MKILESVSNFFTGKDLGNHVHVCEMLLVAALPGSTRRHMSIVTLELSQTFSQKSQIIQNQTKAK